MPSPHHRAALDLAATVRRTLALVGFAEGRHHRGSGWSDDRTLEYEAAKPGPVVAVKIVYLEPDRRDGEFLIWPQRRVYVDHAGPGRKSAMAQYRFVLERAGFPTAWAKQSEVGKKEFLWVQPAKS